MRRMTDLFSYIVSPALNGTTCCTGPPLLRLVIGSTCTVKLRVKRSSRNRQIHPRLPTPPPLPSAWGAISVRGHVAGHSAEPERIYWTNWPGISRQIQFPGTTISCVLGVFQALRFKFEWQLKVCWGRRPWRWVWRASGTQAVLHCPFATVCHVWMGQALGISDCKR